ncbi:hypothetical protein P4112_06335 [Pseudomonas aeruginosa]|nr:hypothetical protein [Pseudomonas aeruginosa]
MPTRVLRGLVAALPLFLAACSDSAPSSEEIARLLAERGFDKPACASSTLFKTFPVTLSDSFSGPGPAKGNAAVYDALVGVGLLRRDGDSYDLTPAGREDYKPESKAFCYSSGFDVSVRSVDPAKPDDYGPAGKGLVGHRRGQATRSEGLGEEPRGAQAGQPDHPATDHPTAGRPGLAGQATRRGRLQARQHPLLAQAGLPLQPGLLSRGALPPPRSGRALHSTH